ncbi:long-chain fatty acid--CoA ligase [Pueribacillus theae]|uniref:Long-chain fatty acid--CoA ligase n=1 Tax=Pueribacillus theae TaxID=2171751 RepID=A0A2U1K7A8_9BACI|nr:long-chain fatty acid--CoA ligase [Pueribacillus theae]PWA12768.1 long-chain fatty acid--CoA ligase [Pueribacillus theae]
MVERPWRKHYTNGMMEEIDIPHMSLPELFRQSVENYRNHVAITYFDQELTYGELFKKILSVASAFCKQGLKKGDRIALMLPNNPYYPISYYAALFCGATVVQINPMYKPEELGYILNDSGAAFIVAHLPLAPVIDAVKENTKLKQVYLASPDEPSPFDQLLQDEADAVPNVSIDPKEDVAVLQYTGGTTGRSKGAMLTHYNLVANTLQSAAFTAAVTEKGKEKVLTASPLFHVYGMTSGMNLTFYNGGNMILLPKFDVEQAVKTIMELKPTSFPGVPTMYIALLNYVKQHPMKLDSFKTCSSGSAPLPVEVLEQMKEITGAPIAEGYGLSEASPTTHRNPVIGLQKVGSIGIPFPNTDAKIFDSENGKNELGIGEVGELAIKGPQVMKGYWKMPEETKQALRDGWLFTGDLAKMDEDGYFYIVGRKKEMIIASGYNIYPVEIEDVLYEHPKVLEAAVIGVPHPYRGETVKAVIVPRNGESISEEEITSFCSERLAAYKVPKMIEFREELPKSAVGKILKRKLQEESST